MPIRFLASVLALGFTGCAVVSRHAYFEPVPEEYPTAHSPKVLPITESDFHVSGIILPFFPYYSRASPLILRLDFPSYLNSCPPVHIGRGMERDTVHATSRDSRSCYYEAGNQAPEFVELDWTGRTLRTGFHRDVDWSYHPFFFPTH